MKARTRPNTASNNPHAVCCQECAKARSLVGEAEARLAQAERALGKADAVMDVYDEVEVSTVEADRVMLPAIAAYRTERKKGDCEHGYKAAGGTATCPVCERKEGK